MWRKAPFAIVGLLLAIFVVVQLRPSAYKTTRSIEIAASPEAVYRKLEDLHQWQRWSPWNELETEVKRKHQGPRRGLGASYTWDGSGSIGQGKVTIAEADEPLRVVYRVDFIAPWNATVQNEFALQKSATGSTLTWSIVGRRHFWSKLFGMFSDADKVLGRDMERGLATLKQSLERPASSLLLRPRGRVRARASTRASYSFVALNVSQPATVPTS